LTRYRQRFHPEVSRIFLLIAIHLFVIWHYVGDRMIPLSQFPTGMQWKGLSFPGDVAYITAGDRACLSRSIDSLSASHPELTLMFWPRADGLLLRNEIAGNGRAVDPLFCTIKPDVYILHESRYLPQHWNKHIREDFWALGIPPEDSGRVLCIRDETERWIMFDINEIGSIKPSIVREGSD
jgi:hypothetical protein